MNEDTIKGDLQSGTGKLQAGIGEAIHSPEMQVRGDILHAKGKANDLIGTAKDAVVHAADKAGGRARKVYVQAKDRVVGVTQRVEPFVQEKPYVALGLAAAVGLLVGVHLAGRNPRVIYVTPAD
jgi:ElaB/YqjD/DUF883 family membrane-anchored ribosome-binding protein